MLVEEQVMENSDDYIIACNIVRKLFGHVNSCIQNDKSKVKINRFEKGVIKGMLGENTLNGINKYIMNMYPSDMKLLMNDLEIEFNKKNIGSQENLDDVKIQKLVNENKLLRAELNKSLKNLALTSVKK